MCVWQTGNDRQDHTIIQKCLVCNGTQIIKRQWEEDPTDHLKKATQPRTAANNSGRVSFTRIDYVDDDDDDDDNNEPNYMVSKAMVVPGIQ